MLSQTLTTRRIAALGLATLLTGVGGPALARSSNTESSGLRIEGTWLVEVTLRNCSTGAPLGSVNSIVTFAPGGTVIETPGGVNFAPGQRSDGQGFWKHSAGHTFTQRFVALIRFDTPPNPPVSPGFQAGWQTVTHTVQLLDADTLSSSGTNEFFDVSGNVYRSGCSTAAGRRFE